MLESMLVQRDLAGRQELEGFSFGQQKSKVGSGELHGHVDGVVPMEAMSSFPWRKGRRVVELIAAFVVGG